MTNYYVSTIGNDGNTGTSVANAFATISQAYNFTHAGDIVNVLGGTYTAPGGDFMLFCGYNDASGANGNPITFQNYQNQRVILKANVINPWYAVIDIAGANNINITGFEIVGTNPSLNLQAALWNSANSNYGANILYQTSGINIDGNGNINTKPYNISVTNCIVRDFPGGGIAANFGDYFTIANNHVFNCALYAPYDNSGISLYQIHDVDANKGFKTYVYNNLCNNNINLVGERVAGANTNTNSTTAAGNAYLHFASTTSLGVNYVIFNLTHPTSIPAGTLLTTVGTNFAIMTNTASSLISSGDIIYAAPITDGEGIIIDDNKNDQSDNIPYKGKTLIYNNVCWNNGGSGIEIYASGNVLCIYNTCVTNQINNVEGDIDVSQAINSNVYNNLCYSSAGKPSIANASSVNTQYGFNLVFGGAGATLGSNNVNANPSFVNINVANYQLTSNSPAIDAASNAFTVLTDILKVPRPQNRGYDIGAYEYVFGPLGLDCEMVNVFRGY